MSLFLKTFQSEHGVSHNAKRTVQIPQYKASRYIIFVILLLFPLSSKCSPGQKCLKGAQFLPFIRNQTFLSQNIYTSLIIVFQETLNEQINYFCEILLVLYNLSS